MNKIIKYCMLFFLTLLVSAKGVFAGWDDSGGGFVSPATENLDMDGYNLLKVGGITGDGTYTGFGGKVTSHSLSGEGDIVCNKGEFKGDLYSEGVLRASSAYLADSRILCLSSEVRLINNYEHTYGDSNNFFTGYSSVANKLRFGTGGNCTVDANVAFEIDTSTNCKVVNDLTVGDKIVLKSGVEIINSAGDYLQFKDSNGYDCEFQFNTNYVALNCDRAELRLKAANGGIVSIYDGSATPTLQFNPSVTTTNAYIQVLNVSGPPNPSPNLVLRNLDTGDIEILADANTDILLGDGGTDDVKIADNGVLSFVGTARMSFPSKTEAELKALSCAGFAEGTPYWDSTNKAVVTSTGTSTGSFGLITDGTSLPTGW